MAATSPALPLQPRLRTAAVRERAVARIEATAESAACSRVVDASEDLRCGPGGLQVRERAGRGLADLGVATGEPVR
jgi:hypothetical protein